MRRNVKLTVGDLVTGQGFEVTKLKIDFDITKFRGGAANIGTVRIYNLAPKRREQLETLYNRCVLEFGYDNVLSVLFVGQIYNVLHEKTNAKDTVTTLYLGSGINALQNATLHQTFAAGTSQRDIVTAITDELIKFDVNIGFLDNQISDEGTKQRGQVISGAIDKVLDNVLRDSGLTWSIEDNELEIRGLATDQNAKLVVTPANGLIGSAKRTTVGIDFDCVLNPALRTGLSVGVFSEFATTSDTSLNFRRVDKRSGGYVTVNLLKHVGGNRDGQAISSVVGIR